MPVDSNKELEMRSVVIRIAEVSVSVEELCWLESFFGRGVDLRNLSECIFPVDLVDHVLQEIRSVADPQARVVARVVPPNRPYVEQRLLPVRHTELGGAVILRQEFYCDEGGYPLVVERDAETGRETLAFRGFRDLDPSEKTPAGVLRDELWN